MSAPEIEKTDLVTVTIDGIQVSVPKDTLVIRAAEQVGVQVPRFCDHPLLAPVGACRQCLVDVPDAGNGRGFPKPQASCTLPVAEGMVVNTQVSSPVADKAQQGVMELLLINHPLDCPVCDKGGECPLQNQAMSNGQGESRFSDDRNRGVKRTFPKPINLSPTVLLDRERCIVCQRCTRFADEIAGDPFIALVERGAQQQIGIAEDAPFLSYFAGNVIQICPVGALTSEQYRFRSRPFDLVSTPGVAEHDACGSAIRVDHRRGKVLRRQSGDDPAVNEEWITDKDRFAFAYAQADDRITYPQVRDDDGSLRPASWPEAFAVAARGLAEAKAGAGVGVLTGGRLTAEDAYAYAKLARVALGTNDIDFRARPLSAEETDFLASHVVLTGPESGAVTYADLESAAKVVLVGLEPEDEAGAIFLRLRKSVRAGGTEVVALAPFTTRGLDKVAGRLVPTVPGDEPAALRALAGELDATSVLLVGERLAVVPGALSAAAEVAAATGARLAWVPRRAGDRGAIEAGCLPTLLPGGRPVADAGARVDVATAWGVAGLPETPGRDADAIVAALVVGELSGLVVAGVDPDDTADPAATRAAVAAAGFVVALDLRRTEVTDAADVVFPVAPTTDKSGTFVNWEGRVRPWAAALHNPASLPELRALSGIADELGAPLGFRTVDEVRTEMAQLGPWDGARAAAPTVAASGPASGTALSTWKQLLDNGSLQDGDKYLKATARTPVALVPPALYDEFGPTVTLTGDRGSMTLPAEICDDLVAGTVWVPANSVGNGVLADLASPGTGVTVSGAEGVHG
ncbi:NADH-quinone oxidoreductase subunit G [Pimelobacter simplex]|uniref:NADH-quinone oxidoreductase subunit G n=1 Tax=Nocardioides simplex TaxID=2045 RepID=UPI0021503B40|nr:NADH-quinone oxidoreductase subunit G [Pimelobacter simplex]UUW91732.1 NADH-quinone oxidoreductase subunit G [Pimelobacter simplex]UUW95560.1 NADH-quinone oxidoreductase subunit G [Pimelobacter simplex]